MNCFSAEAISHSVQVKALDLMYYQNEGVVRVLFDGETDVSGLTCQENGTDKESNGWYGYITKSHPLFSEIVAGLLTSKTTGSSFIVVYFDNLPCRKINSDYISAIEHILLR